MSAVRHRPMAPPAGGEHGDSDDNNFTDDESSPLTHDIYGGSQRTIQETKGWDVFRDPPIKIETGSTANQECLELTIKILKIFAYIFTFIIVLTGGVIAKGTVLFMASQVRKDRKIEYCNKDLGRDKSFVVVLPEEERIAWIWALVIAYSLPEFGALIRAVRICFFKTFKVPKTGHFLFIWLMESMSAMGTALLMFVVLPQIDAIQGAMLTNCLCVIPGIFGLLSRTAKEGKRFIKVIIDLAAIAAQVTGLVIWPLLENRRELWVIPVACVMISCGWWENYVSAQSPLGLMRTLGRIKEELHATRYFCHMFLSVWKILLFFCVTMLIYYANGEEPSNLFGLYSEAFGPHKIVVYELPPGLGGVLPDTLESANIDTVDVDASYNSVIYVLLLQVFGAYLCYIFGKFACKILIQGFSYAFPVSLTGPIAVSFLISACGIRIDDPCFFHGTIPDYLFFTSPSNFRFNNFVTEQMAWAWILWLLSQTWIALHIWTPKCERLATTEKLFVRPMYSALLIDQSMALNRRRDDQADVKTEDLSEIEKEKGDEYYETISVHTDRSSAPNKPSIKSSDNITRIYTCATMWHETKDEMMEFLKSIMRMDEDQCARRVAQKYLRVLDPDYYEFETHIFFDDAFEISDHSDDDIQCNRFVKLLIGTMDEAASEIHQTTIRLRPPKKYPTPYGGRLVWTLPGKTKFISHLKDKDRIRHRKRWSQVMYMYYLLGHRLMELPISVDRKDAIAENTYLLTLDGDIDFKPNAVTLLVDLMKKNRNLGAACGRIHPVGSGPMVWYQLFEYAIGHWLQKATEHMIGCVLCSPGCFSLFRGKALMDDNVMKKYTTKPTEARHYVQYDQGEDRWLCTLLLQRGYRVEYSAASDAYTHCPEGFNEFYNQRRRWVPSTIANIMDLLGDAKRTIKINDNISLLYVFYQMMLMGGTILGPGTIFLMLVGAFVAAFRIDNWTSFHYNIVPILGFMLICFTCKSNIQLFVAQVLSTCYALIMMAVIVGTALQLGEDGIGSPSAIFLISMVGSFFIAACLHPQEFWCITCGLIYLLSIPSMYLLLILYSIINLNVVSWGTREVVAKKTKKELEAEKKAAEEAKKRVKQKSMLSFLQSGIGDNDDEEGSIEFSLAGLFRCVFCTHGKTSDEKQQLTTIAESLDTIKTRMDTIESAVDPHGHHARHNRRRTTSSGSKDHHLLSSVAEKSGDESDESDSDTSAEPKQERDFLTNPYWIEDPDVRKGEVDFLSSSEIQFWKDLIDQYLYPIDNDPVEQARIAKDLKELRDSSVFAFFMINALFVLIVFLLQLNKDNIHVKWPFGVRTNITYDESSQEVHISKEYLQLEPIGLVFVFFFALILVIQFTAMLFHRFGTISHILASTELNFCKKKSEDLTQDQLIDKHAVEIVKNLQRLQGIDGDYDNDSGSGPDRIARRKTIQNLEKARQPRRQIGTLDVAFKKRFLKLTADAENNPATPILTRRLTMRAETIRALEVRKNSVMAERRKSAMQTLGAKNEYGITTALPVNNNGAVPNQRSGRVSNAGISIKDVFNVNGGPAEQIYGSNGGGTINQGYEHVIDEDGEGNSLRLTTRNPHQVSWGQNTTGNNTGRM
ncbi:chitin synthase chs-2 isoform X1 [Drosophila sulfurigaster albostrigata]|uniref:chitin synthase chs-2 isoform X1 n=1 Tax=Drosophila nasuta TaxID=42062 RepID=UPI00295ED856|nr:chitin synthase chs-2 isoform X1 [Drosophila nasuta]XP_060649539.1 chitin synthase chs-2 isoform X1 [Drosophila nasuta]XP_062126788.1 chitin synthase chs-2 isoform X1 [Drosophila sulfurigaster albostrigata]XP_062126791.1 chitin synthase chs-2 isoform X1 [Drosophila sulfurigaster albostrigata]